LKIGTVSEINGDFGRKLQIFPTPRVFNAPAGRSPWHFAKAVALELCRTICRKESDDYYALAP